MRDNEIGKSCFAITPSVKEVVNAGECGTIGIGRDRLHFQEAFAFMHVFLEYSSTQNLFDDPVVLHGINSAAKPL